MCITHIPSMGIFGRYSDSESGSEHGEGNTKQDDKVQKVLNAQHERFTTAQELFVDGVKKFIGDAQKTVLETTKRMATKLGIVCFFLNIILFVSMFVFVSMKPVVIPVTTTCPSQQCPLVTCRCLMKAPVCPGPVVKPCNEALNASSDVKITLNSTTVAEAVVEIEEGFYTESETLFLEMLVNATAENPATEAVPDVPLVKKETFKGTAMTVSNVAMGCTILAGPAIVFLTAVQFFA